MGSSIGFCPAGRHSVIGKHPISPLNSNDQGRDGAECVSALPREEVEEEGREGGVANGGEKWVLGPVAERVEASDE